MSAFAIGTLGLSAHSLWVTARTTRAAIRRGDWPQAHVGLQTIRRIETAATVPSLAVAARSTRESLAADVSDCPQFLAEVMP